jgi:FAD/FMN-containing dehydrogenase
VTEAAWRELAAAVAGDVVRPGAADYDMLRRPAMAGFRDVRPQALVRCEGPEDVAAALAFARAAGLPFAVRSGGHCFAGRSTTEGVVIDVSPLASVAVAGERATIGAGARLGDVYDALAAHGLTVPAGCGPTVGIAGLVLGGGLGILGRLHGLTSDALRAAQVVLADGRVVTCDEQADADLFWALRGAGGARFGVVTSLVFETLPAPPTTAFELVWAPADAAALMRAWQEWAPVAPDAMAASLLLNVDAGALRVRVFGAMADAEAETTQQLGELAEAAGATPTSASVRPGSYRDAKRFLSGLGEADEEDEGHPHSKSEFIAQRLPEDAVDALLAHLRVAPAPAELDLSPWGGAYTRVAREATAFAHRDARFLLKHGVVVDPGAPDRAARDWLARSWEIAHPSGTGGVYPNFPDSDLDDWDAAYHGANRERLLAVKRRYDPENVFG